ncbi:MAG TPA: tRNA (adenosine(37)-N6)-threonylcarbamoyltransferase complex ATPase subunit type 1 TsaE, partial [Candidatus Paceibacterota bacterium]
KFNKMIHIDCYRLENDRDWEVLNMDNILTDPTNLVVVEWPEKIDQLLTLEAVKIEFKFIDENTRIIKILP